MDHPNIARALDAGTTEDGLPYFVMELVAGEPITDYCDRHASTSAAGSSSSSRVCKGVQHAHQKGVIHRDLKPSNILVRETDGRPVPTIIDFGIAKAVERRPADGGFTTELGVMVGTPAYMSPEQAEASGLDIDTRADIYSLGWCSTSWSPACCRSTCTGSLPSPYHRSVPARRRRHPDARAIGSPRSGAAGARLSRSSATRPPLDSGAAAQGRSRLDHAQGHQRDRARRYETANAFALDIERHLEDKPVVARPPTSVIPPPSSFGGTGSAWRWRPPRSRRWSSLVMGIARERNHAERQDAKAQAISGFLEDMLKSADPWQGGARQTTVVEALRAGIARVNAGSHSRPDRLGLDQAHHRHLYLSLGRIPEADTLVRAALAERIAHSGPGERGVRRESTATSAIVSR